MRHILQICTGAWVVPNYTAQDIIARIEAIAAKIDVGGVIIGWNTDASLYREVGAFLHGRGIRMLLWLPCFSELSGIALPDQTVDIFGREVVTPLAQPAGLPGAGRGPRGRPQALRAKGRCLL